MIQNGCFPVLGATKIILRGHTTERYTDAKTSASISRSQKPLPSAKAQTGSSMKSFSEVSECEHDTLYLVIWSGGLEDLGVELRIDMAQAYTLYEEWKTELTSHNERIDLYEVHPDGSMKHIDAYSAG